MNDTLANWEKWPVAALFIASGLYLMEWYAGERLAIPEEAMRYIATIGGVAAMVAVDGAMIATVAGMRQGRRGRWSYAAIVVTALFAAAVALVLHGALPHTVGAWLHAGFVATIATYLLHLAQPRITTAQSHAMAAQDGTAAAQAALVVAQRLIDAGASVRSAAQIVGISESTLRGRLRSASNTKEEER